MKSESKMTISRLARELKVSRQAIYKHFDVNGYDKKNITPGMIDKVRSHYEKLTEDKKIRKKEKAIPLQEINEKVIEVRLLEENECISTLNKRLANFKQEYNYNKRLIASFQKEINQHLEKFGTTVTISHNGNVVSIPQIAQLEKYNKLNISINKSIQELETTLKLFIGAVSIENDSTGSLENDPFS